MSSLPHSQQTNRHLGARLSRIENTPKFKVQGHTAQHLEWTSLLQNFRRILGQAGQRQITLTHKNFTHKQRKHLNLESYRAR